MGASKQKGFTLIELLVVIAVIGILASVVLASLNNARGRARDAKRVSEVKQLALAFTLAADKNGGTFPSSGGDFRCLGTTSTCWGATISGDAALNATLSEFISTIPADPSPNRGKGDRYLYADSLVTPAIHCDGTDYPTGPWILWLPESGGNPNSDALCKNVGTYACCSNASSDSSCSNGLYCAYKI